MKLIPARELIDAVTPHRHDFVYHHENRGLRYYLCKVCGKVYSVVREP